MRPLTHPPDTLLFTAILTTDSDLFIDVSKQLQHMFGSAVETIQPVGFDHSSYYQPEMGPGLLKGFLGFTPPFSPQSLALVKRQVRQIEWKYGKQSDSGFRRTINIDPGYVNLSQVVLSTSKNFSHRIYLQDGIFAEVTLLYHASGWEELPWTYPDYKVPEVKSFLTRCRTHLKSHIDKTTR